MDNEAINQITPQHYAVMLILSRITELKERIRDNDIDRDPSDYFRSQIDVFLRRTIEELEMTITIIKAFDS